MKIYRLFRARTACIQTTEKETGSLPGLTLDTAEYEPSWGKKDELSGIVLESATAATLPKSPAIVPTFLVLILVPSCKRPTVKENF